MKIAEFHLHLHLLYQTAHYSYTILFNVLVLVWLLCWFGIAEFYVLLTLHLITIYYNLNLHTTRPPTYSDIYQRSY